jgi:hypothetical protein
LEIEDLLVILDNQDLLELEDLGKKEMLDLPNQEMVEMLVVVDLVVLVVHIV